MLRKAVVCIMLVAAAAMAWEALDNVPTTNGTGTRIIGGRDVSGYHPYVWGIFPYGSRTRYGHSRVDQGDPQWDLDDGNPNDPIPYLDYTSAAFQREDNGRFFFSGHGSNGSKLYLCDLNNWYPTSVTLPAAPGEGSCITYVPYGDDAGWVYYLSQSNQGSFYRYSLLSAENVVVDGICPGESAIIGNSTPLFQWGSTATTLYRLQVSTDSTFGSTIVDVTESESHHLVTTALANGRYFWRSAAWIGAVWSWSGVNYFRVDVGWTQLSSMTDNTGGVGASMAYKGTFIDHPALLLLVGGGSTHFWEYNLQTGQWNNQQPLLGETPKEQYEGTSLTTQDPTGQGGCFAWASFGGQQVDEFPYYYDAGNHTWFPWIHTDYLFPYLSHSPYPENITERTSMAFGEPHMHYLVTGSNEFFRLDPPPDDTLLIAEGTMSSGTCVERTQAHVITRNCGFVVEYQLSKSAHVRAVLHDAVGRQIGMLDAGEQKPGSHRLSWSTDGEGPELSAGAYFVLLDMGAEKARLKAVVR